MRSLLFISALTFVLGCSSTQKSTVQPKVVPSWTKARPSDTDYYIGVGKASKSEHPFDYTSVAKQSALEELSNEISVKISANSVLSQTEDQRGFVEAYQSRINLRSEIELEGFEVYDSWEDEERFYIYYRLNKREWLAKQEAKKKAALAQSRDWYAKALRADSLHRADEALTYYVKALESIDRYLGEPLEYQDPQYGSKFYGNEVYYHLAEVAQGLNIKTSIDKRQVKQGTLQKNESITFQLVNQADRPAAGLPIVIKYSEQLSRGTVSSTDASGMVKYGLPVIKTATRIQYITAKFDADTWKKEVSDNALVREILEDLGKKMKETMVELEVLPPTFSVTSTELNLGNPTSNPLLGPTVRSVLLENGFATDTVNPDYRFIITTDSDSSGTSRNMATAFLRGEMIVYNGEKEVFQTSFHEVKGVQLNYESAGKAAYREGAEWLTYEVLLQWIDRVRPTR